MIDFMDLLNIYLLVGWLPTFVSASYSIQTSALVGTTLQTGGTLGTFLFAWLIGRIGFVPVLGTAFTIAGLSIAFIGQPALPLALLFVVVFSAGFWLVGWQGAG